MLVGAMEVTPAHLVEVGIKLLDANGNPLKGEVVSFWRTGTPLSKPFLHGLLTFTRDRVILVGSQFRILY